MSNSRKTTYIFEIDHAYHDGYLYGCHYKSIMCIVTIATSMISLENGNRHNQVNNNMTDMTTHIIRGYVEKML